MNDKLYVQDLINLIAEKKEISKKEAETFLKSFLEVIELGLDQDKTVKIKGWGTFKLIRVESRESIDVNTGKRCIIEGHTKISFTPDASVRDFINKPFSHFETVVLNQNVFFDEIGEEEKEELLKSDENHSTEREPIVQKEDNILSEVPESLLESPLKEEIIEEVIADSKEETIDKAIFEENDFTIKEGSSLRKIKEEVENENSFPAIIEDNLPQEKESAVTSPEFVGYTDSSQTHEYIDENQTVDFIANESALPMNKRKNRKVYGIIIAVSCFIIGSLIYYIFNPSLFDNIFNNISSSFQETIIQDQVEDNPAILVDTLNQSEDLTEMDTIKQEIDPEEEHYLAHNEEQLPVEAEEIERISPPDILADTTKTIITGLRQGYENVKADSTSYRIVGTMAIHTVQSGETLTRVSNRFYGSKDLWPYLVKHNPKIIKNPDNVPSGTTIRIPALRDKE